MLDTCLLQGVGQQFRLLNQDDLVGRAVQDEHWRIVAIDVGHGEAARNSSWAASRDLPRVFESSAAFCKSEGP